MAFTFHNLSDIQDAAHIMMTIDTAIKSHWKDSFLRAKKQLTEKFFPKFLAGIENQRSVRNMPNNSFLSLEISL